MESQGRPGAIQITERTWHLVKDEFACAAGGTIDVKGAGPTRVWHVMDSLPEARHSSGASSSPPGTAPAP
jgi:guanylate cyclase